MGKGGGERGGGCDVGMGRMVGHGQEEVVEEEEEEAAAVGDEREQVSSLVWCSVQCARV